ncbi:MAG: glycerophosphodiester phosphodiesterase [Actinomycetota bacterium]|nr:MAG: glycerophosphodiester phosphodiesterase [Actinomycetota bacterium]
MVNHVSITLADRLVLAFVDKSWIDRRVISYAHRGGSFEAPSSTIGALEHACGVGVSGLELDVHTTADRVLICCHDDVVDTTTDGKGKVSKLTWSEIEGLNAGYWFVPQSAAAVVQARSPDEYIFRQDHSKRDMTRLARVDEVLERFPDRILNFDIKATSPAVEPYEEDLARLIMEWEAAERVIVSSFLDSAIWRIRQSSPDISTSAAPGEISEFYFALVSGRQAAIDVARLAPYVAFQIPRFFGEVELATKQFVEAAHAAGKAVHVWTINEPTAMEQLIDIGVDGIISDLPSLMVSVITERGMHYFYRPN